MAINMASVARYLWQGLSTDSKPTGNTVNINDVFFETDTGNFYVFNGASWSLSDSTVPMRSF